MGKDWHCEGCGEDYDLAEENHSGHALCGATDSAFGVTCLLEPEHASRYHQSKRPVGDHFSEVRWHV